MSFTHSIDILLKSLNPIFDDLILMELFVTDTEIKPVLHNGHVVYFTNINPNEVYIKIKAGEMRIAYYDLAGHIRDEIIWEAIIGSLYMFKTFQT